MPIKDEERLESIHTIPIKHEKRLELAHTTPAYQKIPPIRCSICQSIGHDKDRCRRANITCHACGEKGHFHYRCPTNIVCYMCGGKGHSGIYCKKPPELCENCQQRGHTLKKCKFCVYCNAEGHATKTCMSQVICRLCKGAGHRELKCPTQPCIMCNKTGHQELKCPERFVGGDPGIMRVPHLMGMGFRARLRKQQKKATINSTANSARQKLIDEIIQKVYPETLPREPRAEGLTSENNHDDEAIDTDDEH
ncbi:hypothetical protein B0T26DRAFT_146630 [Lasiosphaeria miniovina]|uniref:CCHC-type domain-containing protein n=1 Tax=Lasiosphaeria miniovina TaxID=1954250 RepID=A0AA40B560_9PEZI|nr:uncharacterized protein B0T26DRAFT_146630 [Lasiosphaeria miniovina]KAK0727824.1 hypothetical protein B0T26DRAFT_146630 [Lasiosphaeria miniovina]